MEDNDSPPRIRSKWRRIICFLFMGNNDSLLSIKQEPVEAVKDEIVIMAVEKLGDWLGLQ
jgi:hypothetical protein